MLQIIKTNLIIWRSTPSNKSIINLVTILKKIYPLVAGIMTAYFVLMLGVFPQIYSNPEIGIPKPTLEVTVLQQVKLGESFEMTLSSNNIGADADLQTVTVEFPQNQNLDNIKVVSYDFLQSPKLFVPGKQIGSSYNGNKNPVEAKYPFLEAYNRPSRTGHSSSITLQITPTEAGVFTIYTKTVAMPHISDQSHYPKQGILDQQNEFVQEHKVMVVP